MNLRHWLPWAIATTSLALCACATTSPPAPMAGKADQQLQALRQDPQVAKWAPDALADAEAAVQRAQHPDGGQQAAQHLAFMAEIRVQIAKAAARANREQAAYKALQAQRDAIGTAGGNDSITTLSQTVMGDSTVATPIAPSAQPTPLPGSPAAASSPPSHPAAPAAATTDATSAPAAVATATSAPEPAVPASGALLTLQRSDFRGTALRTAARAAVRGLLPQLVQAPSRQVVVSGTDTAQLSAVRQVLADTGLPAWRLQTRRDGTAGVSIGLGGTVSTPALH